MLDEMASMEVRNDTDVCACSAFKTRGTMLSAWTDAWTCAVQANANPDLSMECFFARALGVPHPAATKHVPRESQAGEVCVICLCDVGRGQAQLCRNSQCRCCLPRRIMSNYNGYHLRDLYDCRTAHSHCPLLSASTTCLQLHLGLTYGLVSLQHPQRLRPSIPAKCSGVSQVPMCCDTLPRYYPDLPPTHAQHERSLQLHTV